MYASVALATADDADRPAEFGQASSGFKTPEETEPGQGQNPVRSGSGQSAPSAIPGAGPENPPPSRLAIDSLDVDAPVVPSGVSRAGNAEIPPDGDIERVKRMVEIAKRARY